MIRRIRLHIVLAAVLGLYASFPALAQDTWRVDSLMTTWPVTTRMEEVRNQLSRGVIKTIDTRDLNARLIRVAGALPVISDSTVEDYIHIYGEPRREQFRALLGMAQAYFPMIETELKAQGLPLELKYLPMAMSGMNAQAASPTGEAGLWMLTWPVALRYGLVVTAEVDERHDVRKSTAVATRYLKDLFKQYGNWDLATMAFACGPANVTRAQQRAGNSKAPLYTFMSDSHSDVLPMLMAFIYLASEAEQQGIEPIAMRPWEPVDSVSDARVLRFDALSAVMRRPSRQLRAINPTLIGPRIPAGMKFCVPASDRGRFLVLVDSVQRLDQSLVAARAAIVPTVAEESATQVVEKTIKYKVRPGDNLGAIAQRHRVTVSQLKKWNHLRSDRINAGKYLTIHVKTREKVKAPVEADEGLPEGEGPMNRAQPGEDPVHAKQAAAEEKLDDLTYTVQSGDSLYRIAKRYPGLTVQRIMEVNGIGSAIQPGQKLKIPASP